MRNLLVFIFLLSIIVQLHAQCPTPVSTGTMFSLTPSELPCIQRGNFYHEYLTIFAGSSSGIMNASVTVDSVTGIPDGISYQITQISSKNSCIELMGTTFDTIGTYSIEIYGTFILSVPLLGNVFNQSGKMSANCLAMAPTMLTYTPGGISTCTAMPLLEVINPGDSCCSIGSRFNRIKGITYLDIDTNGQFDSTDYPIGNQQVLIGSTVVFSNNSGVFEYQTATGSHVISMNAPPNFSLTTNPPSYSLTIADTCSAVFPGFDFGLKADTAIDNVSITLNIGPARPGFQVAHHLSYKNLGTTLLNDTIILVYDTKLTFSSSSQPFISHVGNEIKWVYAALVPGSTRNININFQLPANPALLNDTLHALAAIGPNDIDNSNNTSEVLRIITGAYDPNEKILQPQDWHTGMNPENIMHYTINFQNTGTDTAFTVEIRDTLDEHLAIATFEPVAQSHEAAITIKDGKYITWTFYNILLPDSNIDEPGSHGFASFNIQPKAGLPHGLIIENEAAIYFDYNPPIITNSTRAKIAYTDYCTPDSNLVQPGYLPLNETITCINQWDEYSTALHFKAVDFANFLTNNLDEHITIDSITGLPSGLSYDFNKSSRRYLPNETGCVLIHGTSFDDIGEYPLDIWWSYVTPQGIVQNEMTRTFNFFETQDSLANSPFIQPVLEICENEDSLATVVIYPNSNWSYENKVALYASSQEIRVSCIKCTDRLRSIRLVNVAGQEIISVVPDNNTQHTIISNANLLPGIYFCLLNFDSGKSFTRKIVLY